MCCTFNNVSCFLRFQLMYGVTELESIHLLGSKALAIGMLEEERDQELGNYLALRCEMRSELCIKRTIAKYADQDDETYGRSIGSDFAVLTRDIFLDILSDARTVAPIVQMAEYHSAFNKQSYFYIFAHRSKNKNRLVSIIFLLFEFSKLVLNFEKLNAYRALILITILWGYSLFLNLRIIYLS